MKLRVLQDAIAERHPIAGVLIGAALGALFGIYVCSADAGAWLRNFIYDQLSTSRPKTDIPEIVQVVLDSHSLQTLAQRGELDRKYYVQLVDNLRNARGLIFDVTFSTNYHSDSDAELARAFLDYTKSGGCLVLGALEFTDIKTGARPSLLPQEQFRGAIAGWGFMNIVSDPDKVVRRHWSGTSLKPALAYEAARHLGVTNRLTQASKRWVNYYGGQPFKRYPLTDALTNKALATAVEKKIVFIGKEPLPATTAQISDRNLRPDDYRLPGSSPHAHLIGGVQVHASIYANLRRNDAFGRFPRVVELTLCLLLGAIVGLRLSAWRPLSRTELVTVTGFVLSLGFVLLYTNFGLYLSIPFIFSSQIPVLASLTLGLLWQNKQIPPRECEEDVEGLQQLSQPCTSADRSADVVFIHGLNGHPIGTWTHRNGGCWPRWLAEDLPSVGVWSLGYNVNASEWKGDSMPLSERARNILKLLETWGLGTRPLVFVVHSFGGLLIKEALRVALDVGSPAWKELVRNTKGIVFLSTPNSGASLATWIKRLPRILRASVTVDELRAHHPRLRDLNSWFREKVEDLGIKIEVYYEKHTIAGFLIVDETSADPGLKGVVPIPLDADHIDIAKPKSKTVFWCKSVTTFVQACIKKEAAEEAPLATP